MKQQILDKLQMHGVSLTSKEFDVLNDALDLYLTRNGIDTDELAENSENSEPAGSVEALLFIRYVLYDKSKKGFTITKLFQGYNMQTVYDLLATYVAKHTDRFLSDFVIVK